MLEIVFLTAAVIGGTVMVCQFLLTLVGIGDDSLGGGDGADFGDAGDAGGFDGDFDGIEGDNHTSIGTAADAEYHHADSSWLFGVLSFRTLVAAAAFFGIAGKAAVSAGYSQGLSFAVALVVGVAAMYGMYWLMSSISRLQSSGNERISNAIGRRATVYVPVPGARAGAGKVQVSMQNRIVEYQAVSDEADRLATGETVDIVAIVDTDTVQVRRVPAGVEA